MGLLFNFCCLVYVSIDRIKVVQPYRLMRSLMSFIILSLLVDFNKKGRDVLFPQQCIMRK